MNIFSNIGITEVIVILLLALLVVGPERLPEMGRKLGQTLRDLRQAYENLTRDLGPEIASIQQTTRELRESVDAVTSIPQDMTQKVIETTGLEDTVGELKEMQTSIGEVGATLTSAGKMVRDPVGAAVDTARDTLLPKKSEEEAADADTAEEETGSAEKETPPVQDAPEDPTGTAAAAEPEAAVEAAPSVDGATSVDGASTGTGLGESDLNDILKEFDNGLGEQEPSPEEQTHD